jgi:hypothetical protein
LVDNSPFEVLREGGSALAPLLQRQSQHPPVEGRVWGDFSIPHSGDPFNARS